MQCYTGCNHMLQQLTFVVKDVMCGGYIYIDHWQHCLAQVATA